MSLSPEHDFVVEIKAIRSEATLELRQSVLWPGKPLSEVLLPEDNKGYHYGAFLNRQAKPVAVISLFLEDRPMINDKVSNISGDLKNESKYLDSKSASIDNNISLEQREVRFRKFACDSQYQGRGIGTQLLKFALSIAKSELGATNVWCDARTSSLEWYAKRGLLPFGDTFFKGTVEYICMEIGLHGQ